jgi:hypothetical protein
MRNKIIIIIIALLVSVLSYIIVQPTTNIPANKKTNGKLTANNLKWIKIEPFKDMLKNAYANELTMRMDEDEFVVNINNQGKKSHTFYNGNDALTESNDFDFSINDNNGNITAKFEIEKKDKIQYVHVPNDVLIGVLKNKEE